jgi:hypothetical protein
MVIPLFLLLLCCFAFPAVCLFFLILTFFVLPQEQGMVGWTGSVVLLLMISPLGYLLSSLMVIHSDLFGEVSVLKVFVVFLISRFKDPSSVLGSSSLSDGYGFSVGWPVQVMVPSRRVCRDGILGLF